MLERNAVIDTLRGVAVLLVILLHCAIHLPINNDLYSILGIKLLLKSGYYAVIMFFVISGFLITILTLKRWQAIHLINAKQFYTMRFARIFPCLLLLLIISSALHLMSVKGFILENTSLLHVIFSTLGLQVNWLQYQLDGHLLANWDILWSLSIEEMFYLFFPILCLFSRNKYTFILIMLIFVILGPIARTMNGDDNIWSDHSYLSCMDGIAIGCLAAIFAKKIPSKKSAILLFSLGILFSGCIFFCRKTVFAMGLTTTGLNVTLLEIGIAGILIGSQSITFNQLKFIRWFGQNSYEIYLSHSFIVILFSCFIYEVNQSTLLTFIEYMMITLSAGILGHFIAIYFSKPLNDYFRNRQGYQKVLSA